MDGVVAMYIDRHQMIKYPFTGRFYTYTIDESKPLDEQKTEKVLVLETKCDIQEAQRSYQANLTAIFGVYFPFSKEDGIPIKRGMEFECDMYGLEVNGVVQGVVPSQLNGCVAYVIDKNV